MAEQARQAGGDPVGGVFLDADAFWRLKSSSDREQVALAWLDALARQNAGLRQGIVVLASAGQGKFEPAAVHPRGARPEKALLASVETVLRNDRQVIQTVGSGETEGIVIAVPVRIGGQLRGSAALLAEPTDQAGLQLRLDQLQWGSAWLETLLQRGRLQDGSALVTVVELLATSLHHERFQEAAIATATELAGALNCERAAIAFLSGRHCKVRALSNSANISRRANILRAVEAAMDEAVDQEATIVLPEPDSATRRVVRAHRALADGHGMAALCTVPLTEGSRVIGALLLERPAEAPFDREAVQLAEHAAALLGPVLDTKRREDRWLPAKAWDAFRHTAEALFGPRHALLKLSVLAVLGFLAFAIFAKGTYRVAADAVLEGTVQRAISAPVAGYVSESRFRAGDRVQAGDLLAALDMTDLRLEKLRWQTERAKQEREYSEAVARKERARARILSAQLDQADAQIALLDAQLERMRLTAPFDGLVVSGDLSQALGAPVERGDVLFEIAPLDSYRVSLRADERDVGDLAPGQPGKLALAAAPGDPIGIELARITPVSAADQGANVFVAEALLTQPAGTALRPGLEGVAKIEVGERRLIWIWTRRVVLWARLFVWSWTP
ncbi:HlyD family efflux transporter periplasmic adaptor subunit [Mangrovicoccus sp. HB161399]|uniref:HlyD family efflux transporter periplasmic adaptor subunit n=1 Tax=Mangrovicoccus sp. HB161399 TaxID=2720392 RepID=UPI00155185D8|nr:HlyD family efflux transporter periplasmic adaptor subunit [Mangrovicoccus sp. HB161399]